MNYKGEWPESAVRTRAEMLELLRDKSPITAYKVFQTEFGVEKRICYLDSTNHLGLKVTDETGNMMSLVDWYEPQYCFLCLNYWHARAWDLKMKAKQHAA